MLISLYATSSDRDPFAGSFVSLEEMPGRDAAYDFTNAQLERCVARQDDHLPIHILEVLTFANGDSLVCSRHCAKITTPQTGHSPTCIRFVVPVEQREHRGVRKLVVDDMNNLVKNGQETYVNDRILNVSLIQDTPEKMVWHVIHSQPESVDEE